MRPLLQLLEVFVKEVGLKTSLEGIKTGQHKVKGTRQDTTDSGAREAKEEV